MSSSFFILAVASVAQVQVSSSCQVRNLNSPTLQHLVFSPTAGVSVPAHRDERADVGFLNAGKALGYTRIRAAFVPCTGNQRTYVDERRSGIKRYFFGKNADKLIKLTVFLKPVDVKWESTLGNLVRHSTKQGETWSTSFENDRIISPYVRADLGSVVTLDASVKSTRDYNATVGGDVLALISQASALITPTSTLLTKENKERFNQAATFVDTAIDGLLKVAIEEKLLTDIPLNPGQNGKVLAVITVNLPMVNNTFPNRRFPNRPLGQWVIYAEGLKQTMLGDIKEGELNPESTSPAAVLNYLVAEKKTLREALAGSKSVGLARDEVVKADKNSVGDKARSLCRAVEAEAESIGLAPVDVGGTMWAYLLDLALPSEKMGPAVSACRPMDHYPGP